MKMENKVPTANEFLENFYRDPSEDLLQVVTRAMLEFAKMHVKLALEDRAENAVTFIPSHPHLHGINAVDKESILNYDYNKIK